MISPVASVFMAICGACMNFGVTMLQCFLLGAAFVVVALIVGLVGFRFPKEEAAA